ncbi:MAG: hypothetical protein RLY31_2660 [Bacteroidota bacterium]|jgi:phosphoribosylamine--glycine ligase
MTKILLLGNGGREHAFAWKISRSPLCEQLFIAPGNAGTADCGTNVALDIEDNAAIHDFVMDRAIDMVVVGPEAPLVNGVWNYLRRMRSTAHVKVLGPSLQGARLEGSKSYAKKFMQEFGIPTASYREFFAAKPELALNFIRKKASLPIVLKADGLAAGKGVVICDDRDSAAEEAARMLGGRFGDASRKLVVESFLQGTEFSVFVLTDGHSYKILPVAKDYKRIGEGDTGPNTGGMGAVSPPPFVDHVLMEKVEERIVKPTIFGLQQRGIRYQGFIFIGLIKVGDDPFVIEYNCRMGDPETEVVLPRIQNDLVSLLSATLDGTLSSVQLSVDPRFASTIILASDGYPGPYAKGRPISGLKTVSGGLVFHAGTKRQDDRVLTNGGRVLAVTTLHHALPQALADARRLAESISFEGKYFRKDIGFDLR